MSLLALGRTGAKCLAPASSRVLAQTEQLRQFAAGPPPPAGQAAAGQDEDLVVTTFRNRLRQYNALMKGLEGIAVPLAGDDAAIKKYADEVEALKKKIGMPDVEDLIQVDLDYKFACSGSNMRRFVNSALEGLTLGGKLSGAKAELLAALDEAEAASGGPLSADNDKGWQIMSGKLRAIESKYGLGDKAKVREEAMFNLYKQHISDLKMKVVEGLEKGRTAETADIQVDLNTIKPRMM